MMCKKFSITGKKNKRNGKELSYEGKFECDSSFWKGFLTQFCQREKIEWAISTSLFREVCREERK